MNADPAVLRSHLTSETGLVYNSARACGGTAGLRFDVIVK